ncbi:hypothetical protein F4859DRAFT_390775 [Xylaria cf. heliscus]|nr:hypothetical protein F4859DRAFT_390775 [Xylaria cf. heliscus]
MLFVGAMSLWYLFAKFTTESGLSYCHAMNEHRQSRRHDREHQFASHMTYYHVRDIYVSIANLGILSRKPTVVSLCCLIEQIDRNARSGRIHLSLPSLNLSRLTRSGDQKRYMADFNELVRVVTCKVIHRGKTLGLQGMCYVHLLICTAYSGEALYR